MTNWLKKFIIKVVIENISISIDKDGEARLEWKFKKELS